MKKHAAADSIWAVVLGGVSIALLLFSYRPQASSPYTSLGGMFWPRILLWGILLLSACLLGITCFLRRLATTAVEGAEGVGRGKYPKTVVYVFFACFGYFLLLDMIGFIFATLLFLCAMLLILGIRSKRKVAIFSITTVAIFWLVFVKLLLVPLPRGSGIFREISVLLFRY
jgi:putative tricarboxylic transport membrane protein